ncbi:MAG: response regulator transcription factor [Gammaproteobacteria bacterium]|nr:response regulator transcription factor [Gammaproteobacteria bacterium]
MDKPTVYLVDDDPGIRRLVATALSRRGIALQAFDSARAFLNDYEAGQPGCLVLDLGLPGMSGLELQQELTRNSIVIPIIFVSGQGKIAESVQAIKEGAIDFLEKPFSLKDLFQRIDEAFDADSRQRLEQASLAAIQQRFERLTDRETEVMQLMLTGAANASSKEIARQLGISHRTVDHHRTRIMEKTGARSVTELALLADRTEFSPRQPETC